MNLLKRFLNELMIRKVRLCDAEDIVNIYNYYIENTIITFETLKIDVNEEMQRIKKILDSNYPFIVYEEQNVVLGYAYLSKWREREAYKNTLETSIYVHKNHHNKGIGKILYKELINLGKAQAIHVLIGGMAIPNPQSQKLHKGIGFERVGLFKEVGYKFKKFIYVEFWQLNIK